MDDSEKLLAIQQELERVNERLGKLFPMIFTATKNERRCDARSSWGMSPHFIYIVWL